MGLLSGEHLNHHDLITFASQVKNKHRKPFSCCSLWLEYYRLCHKETHFNWISKWSVKKKRHTVYNSVQLGYNVCPRLYPYVVIHGCISCAVFCLLSGQVFNIKVKGSFIIKRMVQNKVENCSCSPAVARKRMRIKVRKKCTLVIKDSI